MNIIPSITSIISFLIDLYILRNTQEILKPEYKCTCAKTSHVKLISQSIMIIIGLNFIVLTSMFLLSSTYHKIFHPLLIFLSFIGICVQVYYIYLMITYVNELKKNNCDCVNPTFVNTVYYYSWTRLILAVGGIIMMLLLLLVFKSNFMSTKPLSSSELKKFDLPKSIKKKL
jgi:hypothetical protein